MKVCDAYGAGYFYVPGSDVCLKIGGYVQFRTIWYDHQQQLGIDPGNTVLNNLGIGGFNTDIPQAGSPYTASWKFFTETSLNATAKWMTDWGAATVFLDYRSDVDVGDQQFSLGRFHGIFLDTGYLKIGGLKAGWDASTFDYGLTASSASLSWVRPRPAPEPVAVEHDARRLRLLHRGGRPAR